MQEVLIFSLNMQCETDPESLNYFINKERFSTLVDESKVIEKLMQLNVKTLNHIIINVYRVMVSKRDIVDEHSKFTTLYEDRLQYLGIRKEGDEFYKIELIQAINNENYTAILYGRSSTVESSILKSLDTLIKHPNN